MMPLFFGVTNCGISPIMGAEIPSMSLRPRILVLLTSRSRMNAPGIASPIMNAVMNMLFFTGAVGLTLPVGGVMTRVL